MLKEVGGDTKLAAQKLHTKTSAINMTRSRVNHKRKMMLDTLKVLKPYNDVLRPKKESQWVEIGRDNAE